MPETTPEPDDYFCPQFMWWVCGTDERREGPMTYGKAKALLRRRPDMWMEIVPA